jgi:oxalate decarboxylase
MVDVTPRSLLGTAAAGGSGLAAASVLSAGAQAASFGNPDEPPQGAVNAQNPASLTDPGPHSAAIADQFPAASRELHWHTFAEWAYMTYGSCRVTVLASAWQAYVADVNEGDLWFFPSGYPHSLRGCRDPRQSPYTPPPSYRAPSRNPAPLRS